MNTRDLYPHEILQEAIGKSCAKSEFSIKMLVILSFLGGGYVGFGYLACLRVISGIPAEWNGLAALLGASVFPIALICILIGGGELATGNMMIMALGKLTGRVSTYKLVRNWLIVSLGNLAGAVAMAYFLGHILATWFPVMIFVLIGFQHFVANMFIIPAGIWAGANVSWGQFFYNMIPVFLGNVLGGSSFVAAFYLFAYKHLLKDDFSI